MSNDGSNRLHSDKSLSVLVDHRRVEIKIYQHEGSPTWTLEIVSDCGSSHIWKNEFATDNAALNLALVRLHEDGVAGLISVPSTREDGTQRAHSQPTTSFAQG